MIKTNSLGVRVDDDLRDALEKAAEDQSRSLSNLVDLALRLYLTEHGYLPRPTPTKRKPK
jgi:hypothetical protein